MGNASALVCVNGECDQGTLDQLNFEHFKILVAVDGGLRHLLLAGHSPDLLIGDMDSVDTVSLAELAQSDAKLLRHPTEKDATDLELALLHLAELGVDQVMLIGISGGRLDHSLANLLLLGKRDWPFSIRFLSKDGNGDLITAELPFSRQLPIGSELSLLPLTESVSGVHCSGLYYPLTNATIELGSTLGMSNVVVDDPVSVTLTTGKLLLLHNDPTHNQTPTTEPPQ